MMMLYKPLAAHSDVLESYPMATQRDREAKRHALGPQCSRALCARNAHQRLWPANFINTLRPQSSRKLLDRNAHHRSWTAMLANALGPQYSPLLSRSWRPFGKHANNMLRLVGDRICGHFPALF